MAEFDKVETAADLVLLDGDEIVAGYRGGLAGSAEPGSDRSRSFWHGWRNGMVDSRRAESDHAQRALVRELHPRRDGVLH